MSCRAVSTMKDLREFLQDAELVQYYDSLRTELRLSSVMQLKCVDDEELTKLGMTKPEVRRLRQFFKKECPQGALSKLKKVSWTVLGVLSCHGDCSFIDCCVHGSRT